MDNPELEQLKRVLAGRVSEIRTLNLRNRELSSRLTQRDLRLRELEIKLGRFGRLEERKEALETEVVELRKRLSDSDSRLTRHSHQDGRIAELEAQMERQARRLSSADEQLKKAQSEAEQSRARIAELEAKRLGLSTELDAAQREKERAGLRVTELQAEAQRLKAEFSVAQRAQSRLAELETTLEKLELQLADAEFTAELASENAENLNMETTPAPVSPPVQRPSPRGETRSKNDDLTKIKGIGPTFAGRLVALGYDSYEAIAAWRQDEIDDIAQRLKVNPKRIQRDGWIESAARLARD